jgi:hypothetical protein
MIANNILIREINQIQYVTYTLMISFATLTANYFVHVKLMYRFIYSMIMNIAVLIFLVVIYYYAVFSYYSFAKLCKMLLDYYTANPDRVIEKKQEASTICTDDLGYYYYFLAVQGLLAILKIFAIVFSFRAHKSLMNKITLKKSDIKLGKIKYN